MSGKHTPIQQKLMRIILLTSSLVLVITCVSFFAYEFFTFRETSRAQLATLGRIIAANSTAALAFDSPQDAEEILNALKAEKHIVAACLYDKEGRVFAKYPAQSPDSIYPALPQHERYRFTKYSLEGFQPVAQENIQLGTLYLKSNINAIYQRMELYGFVSLLVIAVSFLLAFLLSKQLQKKISKPILDLAKAASIISNQHDYTIRAAERDEEDELSVLTDAFNHMLRQIETQNSEIVSFNYELEQKIKRRTGQLEAANSALEIVNDKLVKSNRDLEQFAYVASHDLQEPLRKIQTFSELAERNINNTEATKKYVGKISSSAVRMAALIKAVLNYSRLSKIEDQFQATDLNEVINDIKTDFELVMEEKNAVIETKNLPVVYGIPLQLHQLFFNLVSNSFKFSERHPVIQITSEKVTGSKLRESFEMAVAEDYYEITFKDNGIGFEQKYAQKVFTIFQRVHDKDDYPGTGIGLALCKKIVENHQGFIDVKSEIGIGTTFLIYLPIVRM